MGSETVFDQVGRHNFAHLKGLVMQQAEDHACLYRGNDCQFVAALEASNPVARTLLLRDQYNAASLGYVLYSRNYGFKGKGLYIEDICVSRDRRSSGTGMRLMRGLAEIAQVELATSISWVVARNNPLAIQFYERAGAQPLPYSGYDCADLFDNKSILPNGYEVKKFESDEKDFLRATLLGYEQAQNKVDNILLAVDAEHANVYAAYKQGVLVALGISNSNFSSFRTVYGYKLEFLELEGQDVNRNCAAFEAIAHRVCQDAHDYDHTGHLNLFIQKASESQCAFVTKMRVSPLRMSDDPKSFLDMYSLSGAALFGHAGLNPYSTQGEHFSFAAAA
ncbi:MAG: GNAT family N-acetyltransferase [Alphaproteobacteria bacterium]|nr:GNAT family N-acetyltransferase [Alphaproteobacteria bacterium]MCB1551090.1 GNAT family N-acetyltransferase [Alphaproteobacteria bacterium]MCB9985073.1 GNAT family N-acetyltransferase [Micavibrio sp.]